jgi:protocatechuate 3,4-dioxygenase, alpha subunit
MPTTPSQTVGPFFAIELPYGDGRYAVPEGTPGAVWLRGRVLDGDGAPVPDALVETWQAGPDGRFDGFRGFGRCPTDGQGRFEFVTVKPGQVPGPGGRLQAPHLEVGVFARGLLKRVNTRIYFPDEAEANAEDPVLSLVEDDAERQTLIARQEDGALRFDIRLQGDGETTFFAI